MKKAMITIEVLISLLILFLVISTSVTNIKFFNLMIDKKTSYEEEYIAVLSLKDRLSGRLCESTLEERDTINGFEYTATCEKIKESRSFKKGFELGEPSGNFGNHLIKLYKIDIELQKGSFKSNHNYLVTLSEKLNGNY